MAPSLFDTIFASLTVGNVLLLLLMLLMLHYLMVLYEFRNMPPGPRLTTLPVLGNVFSLDFKVEKLGDTFQRSVKLSRMVKVTLIRSRKPQFHLSGVNYWSKQGIFGLGKLTWCKPEVENIFIVRYLKYNRYCCLYRLNLYSMKLL